MLKRMIALTACLAALLALWACGGDDYIEEVREYRPEDPLTVCFDLDSSMDGRHSTVDETTFQLTFTGAKDRERAVEKLLESARAEGGPENVSCQFIEGSGEDRDAALTRVRTELMAGAGPDLFVISHQQYTPDNVFKFLGKKMEENILLPLDGYIEGARFMDTSRMNQAVLGGGRNSKGWQMVVPLRYSFPTTIFPAGKGSAGLSQDYSLKDMLEGSDPALASALAAWRSEDGGITNLGQLFVDIADYKQESLRLSQDEFRELMEGLAEFSARADGGGLGDIASGCAMSDLWDFRLSISQERWGKQPVEIVPIYGPQGGACATILDYAAVNRNSGNPAGAFWLLDYIAGEEQMQSSEFHRYLNSNGLPIYDELMQEDTMLPYLEEQTPYQEKANYIYFTPEDWPVVTAARDQITAAGFPSELSLEIDQLLFALAGTGDEAGRGRLIDDCYKKLQMLLGES